MVIHTNFHLKLRLLSAVILTVLFALQTVDAQVRDTTYDSTAGNNLISSNSDSTFFGNAAGDSITASNEVTVIGASADFTGAFYSCDAVMIGYGVGANFASSYGFDSVFVGHQAGALNENSGRYNTFLGAFTGYSNTTGYYNTFIGRSAGYSNTTGHSNTFIGANAGEDNTTGYRNTLVGRVTGQFMQTGILNSALGVAALRNNVSGNLNTAAGQKASNNLVDGVANTTIGNYAGLNQSSADFNTFVGLHSGGLTNQDGSDQTGNANTFMGALSGYYNVSGEWNVLIGPFTGQNRFDSSAWDTDNADGAVSSSPSFTLSSETTSTDLSRRTALGSQAVASAHDALTLGYCATVTGERGIAIGSESTAAEDDAIAIGYQASSHGSNIIVLGNSSTTSIDPDADRVTDLGSSSQRFASLEVMASSLSAGSGAAATIDLTANAGTDDSDFWRMVADTDHTLAIQSKVSGAYTDLFSMASDGVLTVAGDFHVYSDARLKEGIQPIENAPELLAGLQGQTYHWKDGTDQVCKYGVIAQEVEEVVPELVQTSPKTGYRSVNYAGFIPLLVDGVNDLRRRNESLRDELKAAEEVSRAQADEIKALARELAERRRKLEKSQL